MTLKWQELCLGKIVQMSEHAKFASATAYNPNKLRVANFVASFAQFYLPGEVPGILVE